MQADRMFTNRSRGRGTRNEGEVEGGAHVHADDVCMSDVHCVLNLSADCN